VCARHSPAPSPRLDLRSAGTHGSPLRVVVPSMLYPSGSSKGSVPRMNSENHPRDPRVRPILGQQIAQARVHGDLESNFTGVYSTPGNPGLE